MNNFAVFILTHGRPDNVITLKTLKACNYTGKIYFIVDDEDTTVDKYKQNFGEEFVKVFSKKEIAQTFDEGIVTSKRKTIVYARNASFKIASELGLDYFLQLDDDYREFSFRFTLNKLGDIVWKYKANTKKIDDVFKLMIEFLENTPTKSIAFAQNGDLIGGKDNTFGKKIFLSRKCMNTFFCSTKKSFNFIGHINEDVNTYTNLASVGELFFTVNVMAIGQKMTQKNKGGMTEVYVDGGTYYKSFMSVMMMPSAVKIQMMGEKNRRIHHSVSWNNTTPLIMSEKWKKH